MKKIILPLTLIVLLTIGSCQKPKANSSQYPGKMTPQAPCPGGCK